MKKIVIVYGGNSLESEISILTSLKVYQEFLKINKSVYLVYLDHDGNFYSGESLVNLENYPLKKGFKKTNFVKGNNSFYFQHGLKRVAFDYVLILGHGKNIEDGTLSSYFETLKIPYLYDDLSNVSLLQDKAKTKLLLNSYNINQINCQVLHYFQLGDYINKNDQSYPLIIKPSRLGSSIGIVKVNNFKELKQGLINCFKYDETLLIEEYIEEKIEYNIALLGYEGKIILSEIEEVNSTKDILSFYDKYDYSNSNEKRKIKPNITKELKDEISNVALTIFNNLNLCGIYRFDFIFDKKTDALYLNEVNSLPGSLAYYLFEEKGVRISDLLLMYIDILEEKYRNRSRLVNTYLEGYSSNYDLDKLKK